MFTRAAKSVVKNLGQRKYYGGEDNLKVYLIPLNPPWLAAMSNS